MGQGDEGEEDKEMEARESAGAGARRADAP
jgi:hypothetical protein